MRGKIIEVDGSCLVKNRLGFYCWFEPTGNPIHNIPIIVVNTVCKTIQNKKVIVERTQDNNFYVLREDTT